MQRGECPVSAAAVGGAGGAGGAGRRRGAVDKVASCRRVGSRGAARPMLPGPLAPLDTQAARALASVYAPHRRARAPRGRDMLHADIPTKPGLSPFDPLPAIGQTRPEKTKVIVFNLNNADSVRPATMESRPIKLRELKTLTPLKARVPPRRSHTVPAEERRPSQLLRENTYDVLEPVFASPARGPRRGSVAGDAGDEADPVSPRSRFQAAARRVARLSRPARLLCLRERDAPPPPPAPGGPPSPCRLQLLPDSPTEKLNKLSEIFQCLDVKNRHRDRMKKENSWF
ncbi:hypothetical protein JYU34_007579 [Plutella xylostella]|uniref:Uncharacterized protein n=1 Tax=Plutella xylostella TaxID=51655 RepID=A0ABQ7QQS4_PLUXY|nr:hypothetical protein JYU34_007579 [Plutella xylostella]